MILNYPEIRNPVSELICSKLRYAKEVLAQQGINRGSASHEKKTDLPSASTNEVQDMILLFQI